jgi:hypothetical protein
MMKGNEVNTAFEILLEEIELVANSLHEEGAAAFKAGDYDAARRAIEDATRLADFREKVKALQKEWASLAVKRPQPRGDKHTALEKAGYLEKPSHTGGRFSAADTGGAGRTRRHSTYWQGSGPGWGKDEGRSDEIRSRAPSFGSPLHPLAQHSSVVPPYARARRLDEIGFASRHMGDLRIGTKVAAK